MPSIKIKMLTTFDRHLFALLPLYNSSYTGDDNQVIQYSLRVLKALGRDVYRDKHDNVISNAPNGTRAIVAHTDAVGDKEHPAATMQGIGYSEVTDIIYNKSNRRPMGGDDKVGVAAALTIAEYMPDVHCWLFADEEVGCQGSSRAEGLPHTPFGVQLDRRDSIDLIPKIGGSNIASLHTTKAALCLLPHRKVANGGSTDVGALVRRGVLGCAFNMSCGYYNPHSSDEYIVLSEALMAFNDACTLLYCLDLDEDIKPAEQKENIADGRACLTTTQTPIPTPTHQHYRQGGTTEAPKATTATSTTASTNGTPPKELSALKVSVERESKAITYTGKGTVRFFHVSKDVKCAVCDTPGGEKILITRLPKAEVGVCIRCMECIDLEEAEEIAKSRAASVLVGV